MPRKAKGPRLYWRKKEGTWVIRDGDRYIRTGCGNSETELAGQKLAEYIASKWRPDTTESRPDRAFLKDVIVAYAEIHIPKQRNPQRQKELAALCARLIAFAGTDTVDAIKGEWCRRYAQQSSTLSMARRDLEICRAAVNFYDREFGLAYKPAFTLPERGLPRQGHLTRDMAARLLWEAHRARNRHLVRYLLIGLYTGTRSGAILSMQWMPNTTGGYFNLERGVMYRAPEGERKTRKRKPPAAIPNRLLAHLKRWRKQDTAGSARIGPVVHYQGRRVLSVKKSFRAAVVAAELPDWVIPHILRHSAITWAMQAGKRVNDVKSFFGITDRVLEDVYWHHHPDYQDAMRKMK